MTAHLDQPPEARWQTDEEGNEYVVVAEICGPFAWKMLHSWADAVHDDICRVCGIFAIFAAEGIHDIVNVKLGKPVQHPFSLIELARAAAEAVEKAELKMPAPFGWPVERQASSLPLGSLPMGQGFGERLIDSLATGLGFGVGGFLVDRATRAAGAVSPGLTQDFKLHGEATPKLSDDADGLDVSGSGKFVTERVKNPELLDRRSFRTKTQDSHRLRFGCPAGEWDSDAADGKQCRVPVELQSILHPREEQSQLEAQARQRGIPIVADGEVGIVTPDEMEELIDAMRTEGIIIVSAGS